MAVNPSKVRRRIIASYFHTFVSMFVMAIVMLVMFAATSRFGGPRVVVGLIGSIILFAGLVWALSEPIVNILGRAATPDPVRHREFLAIMDELCQEHWQFLPNPRLYVLKFANLPNACAYGMGIPFFCAIGITQELYDAMDRKELKAVLGHELGHLKSWDVGLMTVVTLITGGAEQISKLFLQGKTALAKTPVAIVIGWLFYFFAKFIFPVGRAAISQEREYAADARGALYSGGSQHMISALRKLEAAIKASGHSTHSSDALSGLLISHPEMDDRVAALRDLEN